MEFPKDNLDEYNNLLEPINRFLISKQAPDEQRPKHRRIPLRNTYNFRDLGGYPGADGRCVRWGVLFRSDHLHNLKPNYHQRFKQLGLQRLVDFRSQAERERIPNQLPPDQDLNVINIPVVDRENPNETVELGDRLRAGETDGFDPSAYLLDYYRWYATTFTPEYRRFIQVVLETGGHPLLFHCTAGKDRTGFAAAILLRLLGVDQQTIITDYMLTNAYTRRLRIWILPMIAMRRGFKVARIVRTLMLTVPEYLETAFKALEEKYGSFDKYVHQGLELNPSDINQLRDSLLEEQP